MPNRAQPPLPQLNCCSQAVCMAELHSDRVYVSAGVQYTAQCSSWPCKHNSTHACRCKQQGSSIQSEATLGAQPYVPDVPAFLPHHVLHLHDSRVFLTLLHPRCCILAEGGAQLTFNWPTTARMEELVQELPLYNKHRNLRFRCPQRAQTPSVLYPG